MSFEVGDQVKVIDGEHPYAGCIGDVASLVSGGLTADLVLANGKVVNATFFADQLSEHPVDKGRIDTELHGELQSDGDGGHHAPIVQNLGLFSDEQRAEVEKHGASK